ncbi:MAG: potassium transporter [Hyphomicrobiaceae bacterium]|nr:potassium transporter [Hyphomicrobiaceae bacterium]
MRWRFILRTIGVLIFFFGLTMIFPLTVGFYYRDQSLIALLLSMGITVIAGLILYLIFRKAQAEVISQREGMAIVAVGWAAVGLFGALPFYLGDGCFTFVDAFFESVSGFTTTGSSILTNIEAVSKGILFWRSFIQWLGGMGIIVFTIAVLPLLGIGGMQLFKAEVPGPVAERLTPRIRQTAKLLWAVYFLLTVLEAIALKFAGMSFFDAVCHSFATMLTGGFSTNNASVGGYNSPAIEWIIIVFMFLAGANFSLHYLALTGRVKVYAKDEEFRFYVSIILACTVLIAAALFAVDYYPTRMEAVRQSTFQVVSIITTTGFGTADYLQWPPLSHALLLILMAIGGCAGSTGGGIKVMRVFILLRHAKYEMKKMLHPRAVYTLWFNDRALSPALLTNVLGFFLLFMLVYVSGVVILTMGGRDLLTSVGATAATLGNIGPGLGDVGPASNYSDLFDWEKWLLVMFMLIGRLEIFTVLVLFLPEAWRRS